MTNIQIPEQICADSIPATASSFGPSVKLPCEGVTTSRLYNATCRIGEPNRPCSTAEKMLEKFCFHKKEKQLCILPLTIMRAAPTRFDIIKDNQ